ncbi:MAG: Calx-beta domain-containing protein [Pirellulaceae bacterium]
MSHKKLRRDHYHRERNRRLFFESLEKREVLTTIFFISGNPGVPEPSVPGTTVNAQFTIGYSTMGFPDVGGSVNWSAGAAGDTATSGFDYIASSGTVNLGPGHTSQIINVPVKYDELVEGNEHFRVTLSGNSPGSMIMQSYATGVINDTPPPPPGVSVSSPTMVTEGNSAVFLFTKTLDGPLTVYYQLDSSTTVSGADYTISPAFGSVYFAVGEHSKEVTVNAIEDEILEHTEKLAISITPYPSGGQGPVPYIVFGQGSAAMDFHDGDAGILSQDFDVEWLDTDGNWAGLGDGETLWGDETLRWIPDLPQEIIDDITGITWLKRPHDTTPQTWMPFAAGSVSTPAVGNPGPGYWDITFKVTYGILSFFQAVDEKKFVAQISSIEWKAWNNQQQFFNTDEDLGPYHGPRVFPEKPDIEGAPGGDSLDKVKVLVHLMQPVPMGWADPVKVAIKAFDPDHAHNPTEPLDTMDWNDAFLPGAVGPPTHKPKDNRQTSAHAPSVGGTLTDTTLTFAPTEDAKETSFKIDDPQPGNNFKLVTAPTRHDIIGVRFLPDDETDGVTLYYKWEGTLKPVPSMFTTDVLTVWRTLWIEQDSMGAPTLPEDGPFDGMTDDPNMGNVPKAPIDLLYPAFYPANVVVKTITENEAKDSRDDKFFIHNIENLGAAATKVKEEMKDIEEDFSAWVVEIVGAYEGPDLKSFDPNENDSWGGYAVANTNIAFVYLETIRDRAAYVPPPAPLPGSPQAVNVDLLKQRITLHEVGHLMGLDHSTIGGVMDLSKMTTSNDAATNRFTWQNLAVIQAKPQVFANGDTE